MNKKLKEKVSLKPFLKKPLLVSIVFISVFFLDQSFKYFTVSKFGFLCNKGLFLGSLENLSFLIVPFFCILLFLIYREKNILFILGFALVLSGGFSNFVDRLYFGCVRDFIPFLNISKFNFADAVIVLGLFLTFYKTFFPKNA